MKGGGKDNSDKKRKIQFSEGDGSATGPVSRRDMQREIAERRAAHFARADPATRPGTTGDVTASNRLAPVSSTPTGFLRKPVATPREVDEGEDDAVGNEREAWPGPFSTALAIVAKREAAKKARDEAIAARSAKASGADSAVDVSLLDDYDRALHSIEWPPSSAHQRNASVYAKQQLPALSTLCAAILALNFEQLGISDIDHLQIVEREKLAVELAKLRRCDAAAALKLAVQSSQYLVLPECSEVDEECLIRAMEQAAGVPAQVLPTGDDEGEDELGPGPKGGPKRGKKAVEAEGGAVGKGKKKKAAKAAVEEVISDAVLDFALTVLKLRNCGWGMTDRAMAVCVNLSHGGLEVLQLTGCYRLNDAALGGLLTSCRTSLLSLDLTCNSRLSGTALACIRSLVNLEELVLDNCTQLTDADLLKLLPDPAEAGKSTSSSANPDACPPLLMLSLEGLIEATDASIVPVVARYGSALQALNLSGCVLLTDRSLHCIRKSCESLRTLGLGQLGEVSTAAMLGLFIVHPASQQGQFSRPEEAVRPAATTAAEQARELLLLGSPTDELSATPRIGHLEEVCLQGSSCVTDDVVVQLCEGNKRTLTALDVNGCHQLTGRAIMALHTHCRRSLRTLDLSFVRDFPQEALGALVDACAACGSLQALTVWGCTQLSDKFWNGYRKDSNLQVVGRMTA
jgi:hypothetical protein